MAEVAYRWWVEGRVQGVSFRWFTRNAAAQLGLVGSVRNLADGRVEIEVLGEATGVEELRRQVSHGPIHARVDNLVSQPLEAEARARLREAGSFEIVR